MAILTVYGRMLNMQNGLFTPSLPMRLELPETLISWSDSNITLETGTTDAGDTTSFDGAFTYATDSADFVTTVLSGTLTSIVATDWWHDYETVPETYYASEWSLNGISISYADYRSLSSQALAARLLAGNDNISGDNRSDYLTGMAGDDTLTGNAGNDTLVGGTGADQMTGGQGNDLYQIDNLGDRVIEAAGGGIDTINSLISFSLASTPDVENLQVLGSADLNLRGNALNNVLIGNAGANIFMGGEGVDAASFATATQGVRASLASKMASGQGDDFLLSIENLRGTRFNDRLEGNSGANLLQGDAGNDTLIGGAGGDALLGGVGDDVLTGGAGRDSLTGGAGADVFDFNTIRDSGTTASTRDVIIGMGSGDRIDLRGIDAVAGGVDNAFTLITRMGSANSAVGTGQIGWYQINNPGTVNDRTILRLNNDRDAQIEMTIELSGLHVMKAGMFIL